MITDDIKAMHHLMVLMEDVVAVHGVFAQEVSKPHEDLDFFRRVKA